MNPHRGTRVSAADLLKGVAAWCMPIAAAQRCAPPRHQIVSDTLAEHTDMQGAPRTAASERAGLDETAIRRNERYRRPERGHRTAAPGFWRRLPGPVTQPPPQQPPPWRRARRSSSTRARRRARRPDAGPVPAGESLRGPVRAERAHALCDASAGHANATAATESSSSEEEDDEEDEHDDFPTGATPPSRHASVLRCTPKYDSSKWRVRPRERQQLAPLACALTGQRSSGVPLGARWGAVGQPSAAPIARQNLATMGVEDRNRPASRPWKGMWWLRRVGGSREELDGNARRPLFFETARRADGVGAARRWRRSVTYDATPRRRDQEGGDAIDARGCDARHDADATPSHRKRGARHASPRHSHHAGHGQTGRRATRPAPTMCTLRPRR